MIEALSSQIRFSQWPSRVMLERKNFPAVMSLKRWDYSWPLPPACTGSCTHMRTYTWSRQTLRNMVQLVYKWEGNEISNPVRKDNWYRPLGNVLSVWEKQGCSSLTERNMRRMNKNYGTAELCVLIWAKKRTLRVVKSVWPQGRISITITNSTDWPPADSLWFICHCFQTGLGY